MSEAWAVIRNVEIDAPAYAGPTAPKGQIVGIETAHKIVAALEDAGYRIVKLTETERKPFVIED